MVVLAVLLLAPNGGKSGEPVPGAAGGTAAPDPSAETIPAPHLERIVRAFNEGVALMERYQPVEAAKAFEQVVELAPNWPTARLNYGIALLNAQTEEAYAGAEVELRKVIAAAPGNPFAHYALGMLLKHLSRFDEARVEFERVVQIDPEDPDTHYQLATLVIDTDPAAARAHLEKTLEKVPHHESACYRLQTLLLKAGEKERAQELMERFRALKAAGAGVSSGMKYGEMGRYADVIRAFPDLPGERRATAAPAYTDVAKDAGLVAPAAGKTGWPGRSFAAGAAAFAPGAAAEDIDGDGDVDLYLTGIAKGRGGLYRNDTGRFSPIVESGIDGREAIGAYFGDYDSDGDPDLYLTCAGANRLYRNEGGGKFTDVTAATQTAGGTSLSVGAVWADTDHDGDLDLYVANFARLAPAPGTLGAPNALFRNNGDGTFTDVAKEAGIDGGNAATTGVLAFDFDDDRDVDLYLVNQNGPNRVFLNDRVGRYTDAGDRFAALAGGGSGTGILSGDLDLNGREDLLLLRGSEPARLFLQIDRGAFRESAPFAAAARSIGGAVGALLGDLDLDGAPDLVMLGAGRSGKIRHWILMNDGNGGFAAPVPLGAEREHPDARGAVAVDFEGDGSLELLVGRAGAPPELWRTGRPAGRHWLEVIPVRSAEGEKKCAEPGAVGLEVEVKTGRRIQVASITTATGYLGSPPRRLHFGLGRHEKADYVRFVWPDAVLQSEMEVAGDRGWEVGKVVRKPSSCPILFAWDGKRFAFVTDFLGVGGLGFFMAPGLYAPPDPSEDVRIPPELVEPRDGRYLLRIAEPLEEVVYLDELHLHVYEHPAAWEVYPDERFASAPPWPTGRPFAVAQKLFPLAARDHHGRDVLARLLAIDRRYVDPPKDPRFVGYAEDHWVEVDFGSRLRGIPADARLVLYLYGWVEYTYSHVNYAASQAGLAMRPPRIEVPDGKGGWRVVMEDAGYPAGLPRMMTVDISALPVREAGRFRVRTNMEIFWDQMFIAPDVSSAGLREHVLRPAVAELRHLGYPREYSPDGADPTLYDYHRVDQGVPFKNLTGDYTRFGDVRPLLATVDDRFVVMGRGEEIALEFDAATLPELPEGRARTLVLHADGYCKDMDLYTAFPDTVEPFPYHAMDTYPPGIPMRASAEWEAYRRTWNVRRVAGR